MDPGSETGGSRTRDTALWTVGGILLVTGLVLVAALRWNEGAGRAIGIALVIGLIALALAFALRLLWTRIVRRRGAVVAPSLLVIAGALSVAAFAADAVRQADALRADPVEAGDASECTAADPDPLPPATGGLSYDELSRDQFRSLPREVELLTGSTEITDVRQVLFGRSQLGFVVAAAGFGEEERQSDLLETVRAVAARVGAETNSFEVGGRPAILASVSERVRLVTSSGCYAMIVGGLDERQVTYVARQLLGDPATSG
jgi:hypothetical protein